MAHILNIVNSLYANTKNPEMIEPMEFMPDWAGERKNKVKKQSPEQIKQFFEAFAKDQNKKTTKEKAREAALKRPPIKLRKQKQEVKQDNPIIVPEVKDNPVIKLTKHGPRNTDGNVGG